MVYLPVRELVEHTFAMPLTHADAMRRSRGVQASATAIKFGCKKPPAHFLTAFGWDAGGEGTRVPPVPCRCMQLHCRLNG